MEQTRSSDVQLSIRIEIITVIWMVLEMVVSNGTRLAKAVLVMRDVAKCRLKVATRIGGDALADDAFN